MWQHSCTVAKKLRAASGKFCQKCSILRSVTLPGGLPEPLPTTFVATTEQITFHTCPLSVDTDRECCRVYAKKYLKLYPGRLTNTHMSRQAVLIF
jgi:hypothetical protein